MAIKLETLLQEMPERGASDLFLKAGSRPMFRIDNEIEPSNFPELDVTDVRNVAYSLMTVPRQHLSAKKQRRACLSLYHTSEFFL